MSVFIWNALAIFGALSVACCVMCTVAVLLCIRYAPSFDDEPWEPAIDACDDRECGTDASMDYEHEAATDSGMDAADTADLWSRR